MKIDIDRINRDIDFVNEEITELSNKLAKMSPVIDDKINDKMWKFVSVRNHLASIKTDYYRENNIGTIEMVAIEDRVPQPERLKPIP